VSRCSSVSIRRARQCAEEVGAALVPAVVLARVAGVQLLQCFGEARVGEPDEGVVVVAHQHVGEQVDPSWPEGGAQPFEEVAAIGVVEVEVALVAAVGGEVVDAGMELTSRPSHPARVGAWRVG
jgi:hypothetical protein